ncbi:hypothetical protein pb186bvf_015389 [Paramecium bursaria]
MDQTQENQEGQIIPPDRVQKLVEKIKIYILVKQLKEDGDPIEIIPHLYIGCMGAALNKKKLKEANIVRVLSVCEMPNTDKVEFNWLTINVQDSPNQNITHKFDDSNDFIHEGIQAQQNVLLCWKIKIYFFYNGIFNKISQNECGCCIADSQRQKTDRITQ